MRCFEGVMKIFIIYAVFHFFPLSKRMRVRSTEGSWRRGRISWRAFGTIRLYASMQYSFFCFFLFVCLRTNQHKYIHEKISKWLNHDFNTKCYIWMHNIWLTHRKKKVLSHFHMTFYILFCLFFSYLACHRKCNVHVHMYICAAPFYHSR